MCYGVNIQNSKVDKKQRLLAFKMKHHRPKRIRDEFLRTKEEPAGKRMEIFLEVGEQPECDSSDEKSRRVNMLRARMDEDRLRVLNWMEKKKKEELSITFDMVDNGEEVTEDDRRILKLISMVKTCLTCMTYLENRFGNMW